MCQDIFIHQNQLNSAITDGTPVIKSADDRYAPSDYLVPSYLKITINFPLATRILV